MQDFCTKFETSKSTLSRIINQTIPSAWLDASMTIENNAAAKLLTTTPAAQAFIKRIGGS